MTDINTVTMVGRLTRDIEVSYLNNGTAKGVINLAVNSSKKQGDNWISEASYFEWVIWGKMAENLKAMLIKGKQIAITGKAKQERWEKDGKKNSKILFYCDSVEPVGSKQNGSGNSADNTGFNEDVPF